MSSLPRVQSPARRRWLWPVIIVLALAAAAYWFMSSRGDTGEQGYRTEAITRGEIRTAISATGTLSATATVDVGTQVSGILQTVDVDYNVVVKKDQIIARIDPSTYQVRAGSRNRWLTPDADNYGFAHWVAKNEQALLQALNTTGLHYGEWWGQGIQRNYGMKEKVFSLFNPSQYLWLSSQDGAIRVVPTLYEGPLEGFPFDFLEETFDKFGSVAAKGFKPAEGYMVYHSAARQLFKVPLTK